MTNDKEGLAFIRRSAFQLDRFTRALSDLNRSAEEILMDESDTEENDNEGHREIGDNSERDEAEKDARSERENYHLAH